MDRIVATDLLLAALALAGLAIGAAQMVNGAVRIARHLGASPIFIGAVLLGAGTSLPDALVSGIAAARGDQGIALGNVIGSNTFNVAIALGAAAIITPIAASHTLLRREALLSALAVILFFAVAAIGLGHGGGLLLLALVAPALWVLRGASAPVDDDQREPPPPLRTSVEVARTVGALALIIVSSRVLVTSAEELATDLGASQALIGLTLVAVGTSIPELAVSVQAARRGEHQLVLGNVLGSNLLNSLGVGGLIGLLAPVPVELDDLFGAGILMLGMVLVATALLASGRRLVRWEGVALVGIYLTLTPLVA